MPPLPWREGTKVETNPEAAEKPSPPLAGGDKGEGEN